MLTHGGIWSALDRLAGERGISVSALAKKAGLDATSFNRSKRVTADGRPRWPSTESIAKVLAATGASVEDFLALMDGERQPGGFAEEGRQMGGAVAPGEEMRPMPHRRFSAAAAPAAFDAAGLPQSAGWDAILFPELDDADAYALEVDGDTFLPLYRDGDVLIVSPAASVRRGDRVVVKSADGTLLAGQLVRKTARLVDLRAFGASAQESRLPLDQVAWIARIVWASQ